MERLGTAVVGCGYWGPNLARVLQNRPGSTLVAVHDTDARRLSEVAAKFPQAKAYGELDELLADPGIDAVAVATPVPTHFPIARACLLAGKHVLIEKPMATSSAECLELIRLAGERSLTLMVGHTFLYSGAVNLISEIIRSGDIGDVTYINSQRLNLGIFQSEINVAWDLAPHDLSIILHIFGESPLSLNCQGQALVSEGVEDVTNLSLTFSSRRFATIQSSWVEPRKVRQMTFVGTRKMIVYDDLQPLEKIRIHDVRVDRPPHYDNLAEFQYSYHYGDCHIPRLEQSEPLGRMCEHFVDCVANGRTPLSGGAEGLELVRILEASSRSLKASGAPVSLSENRAAVRDEAFSS